METGTQEEPRAHGVMDSVRGIGSAALGLLQNRVELLGVEIQEQKERLIRVLVLAAVLVFVANIAALLVTYTIVKVAGAEAEKPVLVVLSLLYVGAAIFAYLALRKQLRAGPTPLNETVAELKKDRDWINSRINSPK